MSASENTAARVVELFGRYERLKQWGVAAKLPHTRQTQKDLERFFREAREGKLDVSEIVAVTSDVRRLEKYASEKDPSFVPGRMKTSFDIETAHEGLQNAKTVVEQSNAVQDAAKDAAKDGFALAADAAKVVPWWAWAGGGVIVVGYLLTQIATIAKLMRRGR